MLPRWIPEAIGRIESDLFTGPGHRFLRLGFQRQIKAELRRIRRRTRYEVNITLYNVGRGEKLVEDRETKRIGVFAYQKRTRPLMLATYGLEPGPSRRTCLASLGKERFVIRLDDCLLDEGARTFAVTLAKELDRSRKLFGTSRP